MRRLTYERRIQLLALAAGLPGSLIALILLWNGSHSSRTAWTLTFLIVTLWLGFALSLRQRVVFSLQTLSNLLSAMREEDFSFRAREASSDDALGEVMIEVNALSETLRAQRLGALEATGLLRAVMEEIDVAIFTFDNESRLALVNRAGERLMNRPSERLLGLTAADLGLGKCLTADPASTMELSFPGGQGRWGLRRGSFRQGGLPHQLLVLSDLSRALRDEERQAWQRLIRVLGHELNNSLAPIQSVAQSLESGLNGSNGLPELQTPAAASIMDDMRSGLSIIRSRTEALGRFMAAYAKLARLPQPKLAPVNVTELIVRVANLEARAKVKLKKGPPAVISADADQVEQLLINLIHNAADAAHETGGGVEVTWSRFSAYLEVAVLDEGPGLTNTSNLFVPFFTTKPGGSGIGLVLSRQIAEAHGGSLTLENRRDARGCEAKLRLPI
jgi:two-component system, NtrC family, nitrogen regulation sensor histidine kinase NtrY